MVSRAAMALIADLFSSSCFSNSCLTELALAFDWMVVLRGSISLSIPKSINNKTELDSNMKVQKYYSCVYKLVYTHVAGEHSV